MRRSNILFFSFVLICTSILSAEPITTYENELITIIQKIVPSSVVVESWDTSSGRRVNAGSGVIIRSDGYILTSFQVIQGANSTRVKLSDGAMMTANVIGADKLTGTALLKIEGTFTSPSLANSDVLKIGSWIIAIGNPLGMAFTPATGFISHLRREIGERQLIQVSIPIQPGDSGAPVFNKKGELIGIVVAALGNSNRPSAGNFINEDSNSIGFVTPINDIKSILDQFIAKGKVERGWLGVQIQNLDDSDLKNSGIKNGKAAVITRVINDSPAESAGLMNGDIILSIDGQPIEKFLNVRSYIINQSPQKTIELEIMRQTKPMMIKATLGEMPLFTK